MYSLPHIIRRRKRKHQLAKEETSYEIIKINNRLLTLSILGKMKGLPIKRQDDRKQYKASSKKIISEATEKESVKRSGRTNNGRSVIWHSVI